MHNLDPHDIVRVEGSEAMGVQGRPFPGPGDEGCETGHIARALSLGRTGMLEDTAIGGGIAVARRNARKGHDARFRDVQRRDIIVHGGTGTLPRARV